ncbi:hypothetical protein [Longimicrobium sp.]|uniref:hypothetical protein n=1 Tax=Longimicrobium sp. TaxID=2029185 RepID=UPI003B3AC9DA
MTAAAVRAPARTARVARAHLAASAPTALLGVAVMIALTWSTSRGLPAGGSSAFVQVSGMTTYLLFLPLLHWRGRGGRRSLDQGLPMADARQEWIRAACGALWAALTIAAVLAFHGVAAGRIPAGRVTVHPGLPLAVLGTGLGMYLVGTAVLIRADRPGRALLLTLFLLAVLGLAGAPLVRALIVWDTVMEFDAAGNARVSVPGWLRATLSSLATGVGAVWISILLGRHGGVLASLSGRWMGRRAPAVPRMPAARAVPGPRRTATFGRAVARQLWVLRRRLGWTALVLAASVTIVELRIPLATQTLVPFAVGMAATFWPALVWLDQRRGDWDEAGPIGRAQLRIAHALAGAAWLLAAAVPAALLYPSGIALPLAALAVYLAATGVVALLDRPVIACFLCSLGAEIVASQAAPEHPLSLTRAFSPLHAQDGIAWSAGAALLWIPLLAFAAAAALRAQASRDGHGAPLLPRLRRATQPA